MSSNTLDEALKLVNHTEKQIDMNNEKIKKLTTLNTNLTRNSCKLRTIIEMYGDKKIVDEAIGDILEPTEYDLLPETIEECHELIIKLRRIIRLHVGSK